MNIDSEWDTGWERSFVVGTNTTEARVRNRN
jgi:hypothetical protein